MTTFSDGVYQFGGVPVSSSGQLPMFTGNAWFVNSVIGSDGNSGKKPGQPFATVAAAVTAATASNDDVIYVMSGHSETITSATSFGSLSKAGISIVGLGFGSRRPTFTFTTAATARINVTANNVTIRNCLFIANFADVATCFLNNAGAEMQIIGCEFRDTSSILNFLAIVTNTVTVNSDGLTFNQNKVFGAGTTAATTPIKLAGAVSRLTVNDNYINLAILNNTSALIAHAALVMTNAEVARNKIFRPNTDTATGGIIISTTSTTNTGMVYDNYVQAADVAAAILCTAGSVYGMFNNLYDGDADASGFVLPAIGVN